MKTSAGILIIYKDSILLGHPTNQKYWSSYSIPKGLVDKGEDFKKAAIRETFEEIGVKIKSNQLSKEVYYVDYPNGKKRVYYYIVQIKKLSEIGLTQPIIDKSNLIPNSEGILEIDWAGFIKFSEAKKRILKQMIPLLKQAEAIQLDENKNFLNFEDFQMNEANNEDPTLHNIRFFKGSLLQFNKFIADKIESEGGIPNPYMDMEYEHPKKRKEKEEKYITYQDFENGKSNLSKKYKKDRE